MSRESNYRFSYDKMLALNGNTAPYMLYAYARIQGINRKLSQDNVKFDAPLKHKAEIALAKHLLKFPDVLFANI
jgi:arginyl-tRNA synthetase